ncbi:peptidoglycan-binding protein [Rhizobium ruizarguesonis]
MTTNDGDDDIDPGRRPEEQFRSEVENVDRGDETALRKAVYEDKPSDLAEQKSPMSETSTTIAAASHNVLTRGAAAVTAITGRARALRDLLPGPSVPHIAVGTVAALLIIPSAIGYGVRSYISAAHRVLDEHLLLPDGTTDAVTALAWSAGKEEHLQVGTQSGRLMTFTSAGNLLGGSGAAGAVVSIGFRSFGGTEAGEEPVPITLDPQPPSGRIPSGALGQGIQYGVETCLPGFVWREAKEGDTVCVPPQSRARALQDNADSEPSRTSNSSTPPSCREGAVFRAAFPGDAVCVEPSVRTETREENRLDQSRKTLPDSARAGTRELKALGITAERGLLTVAGDTIVARGANSRKGQLDQSASNAAQLTQYPAETPQEMEAPFLNVNDARAVVTLSGDRTIVGDGRGEVSVVGTGPAGYTDPVVLGSHGNAITAVATTARIEPVVGPSPVVTEAADGSLKVWMVDRRSQDQPLAGSFVADIAPAGSKWTHTPIMRDSIWQRLEALSKDGRKLAVTLTNGDLSIIEVSDPSDAARLVTIASSRDIAAPISFSPDGRMIAGFDLVRERLTIFSAETLSPVAELGTSSLLAHTIEFDASGTIIAVGSLGTSVELFDTRTGSRRSMLSLPEYAGATSLSFDPSGSLMAIVQDDGNVSIRKVADGAVLELPTSLQTTKIDFARFKSGKALFLHERAAQSLLFYPIRGSRVISKPFTGGSGLISLSSDATRSIAFSPEADAAVIGDMRTGKELGRVSLSGKPVNLVSNSDASRIIALDGSGTVTLFTEERDETIAGPAPPSAADGLRLSADGTTLLLREPSGRLHVADLSKRRGSLVLLEPLPADAAAVRAEISPDGKLVAFSRPDGTIELLDVANGNKVDIVGHGDLVQAMVLSPDGAFLASASVNGRLRITNIARTRDLASIPLASLSAAPSASRMIPRYLDQEALVLNIQRRLDDLGYGSMILDGIAGPQTISAIRRFQTDNSLQPTGQASEDLLRFIERLQGPSSQRAN